jgi:hypothetical protein
MKKNYIFLILLMVSFYGYSQCIGTFEYPFAPVASNNDGNLQEISDCNFGGDFATLTGLTIGQDYEFTSSDATDYLTLTDESNNVIATGITPLVVNAISVANARLHIHINATCDTDFECHITTIQCTSCSPAPTPECATEPITPLDGAMNVPAFDLFTLSWTAPASGPTPTSYDIYVGELPDGSDQAFFDNVTTTSLEVFVGTENLTLYWSVIPINGTSEASGCDLWSFTSDSGPAVPVNDDLCNATPLDMNTESAGNAYYDVFATGQTGEVVGSCFNGGINGSVWFSFVAPTSGEVIVSTDILGGTHSDTEIAVYAAPSDCSNAATLGAEQGCTQDNFDNFLSTVELTGLNAGATYYIQVDRWGTSDPGYFGISVFDATLSIDSPTQNQFTYFPNPVKNTLQLNAQSNIQNVSIYNMLGQEVLRITPNNVNSTVDMSSLQTGAYFVKVTINDRTETVRVIKQ